MIIIIFQYGPDRSCFLPQVLQLHLHPRDVPHHQGDRGQLHELRGPRHELSHLPSDQETPSQGDIKMDIQVSRMSQHPLGRWFPFPGTKYEILPWLNLLNFRSDTNVWTCSAKFMDTCLYSTLSTGQILCCSRQEYLRINRNVLNLFNIKNNIIIFKYFSKESVQKISVIPTKKLCFKFIYSIISCIIIVFYVLLINYIKMFYS